MLKKIEAFLHANLTKNPHHHLVIKKSTRFSKLNTTVIMKGHFTNKEQIDMKCEDEVDNPEGDLCSNRDITFVLNKLFISSWSGNI